MFPRARIALFSLAAVACAVAPKGARKDTAAEATAAVAQITERPVVALAPSVATTAPPSPRPDVRVIGHCNEAERARGVATFTLAHMNDLQARYSDRIEGRSRYAYVAGWLEALKREVPETLVLDAGDDYEKGALAELRSMGESTRQMIQALPIDVRTIGNHDFAYGADAVLRDVTKSAHPVLAANVRHTGLGADEQPFRSFVRVDVGCVKVGIIGLVTRNYGADDQQIKDPYDRVFFHDDRYAEIMEREVKAHRAEVDVMIALTHLGYYDDTSVAVVGGRGVDIVVGAHTEDLLKDPAIVTRSDGTRTWIIQAGHFGQTLGRADMIVNLKDKSVAFQRYKIVEVDGSLPHANEVAELADRLEREAAPDAHSVIGVTTAPVKQGKEMADLVWRAVSSQWGVDALIVGKDLFWDGLPKGPVTLQRLYDAVLVQRQPAGTSGFSSMWIADVSGADLVTMRKKLSGLAPEMYGPAKPDPKRTYRLAIDKRALLHPKTAFALELPMPQATFAGELIDVLEAYAEDRRARRLPLDGPL